MHDRLSRRRFGTLAAAAALAPHVAGRERKPSDKLNLAVVGVAGRGKANLDGVAHENVVALCDVDLKRADEARKRFPAAKFVTDFRRLFDVKGLDGVVVSTPDHTHALPTVLALRAGLPVYCEKPLAHTVHEVRQIRAALAGKKLATQLGTQIHAGPNYRRVVEVVRGGVLGDVTEVKVWVNRRPDPGRRGRPGAKPPEGLDYDLWLGPAPERPYHPSHLHFNWRWWWDFGGGVLADMACHFMDLPHWALGLGAPSRVAAAGKKLYDGDNDVPSVLTVEYHYPAANGRPPVKLVWTHGQAGPDAEGREQYLGYPNGVLFVGTKGRLVADYGKHHLLLDGGNAGFARPDKSIPDSVGHHREWLDAVRTGGPTTCDFNDSGVLTEAVLLGNAAYRAGEPLEWDADAGRVTNTRAADPFLRREARPGWEV